MLLPTLVTDKQNGVASLLPPRYQDPVLLKQFNSSPSIFDWGEKFFTGGGVDTSPPRNAHEELFGASGAKFPRYVMVCYVYSHACFYADFRNHSYLCVLLDLPEFTEILSDSILGCVLPK